MENESKITESRKKGNRVLEREKELQQKGFRKFATFSLDSNIPLKIYFPGDNDPFIERNKDELCNTSELSSNPSDTLKNPTPWSEGKNLLQFIGDDIPIPGVRIIEESVDYFPGFVLPPDYITTKNTIFKNLKNLDSQVEYELDSEDEIFLSTSEFSVKQKRHSDDSCNLDKSAFVMDGETLEYILDFLEKESFRFKEFAQYDLEPIENYADDNPCLVCGENESTEDNLIIFCDGCDLVVHQDCQHLNKIPEGNWYCTACSYLKEHNYPFQKNFDCINDNHTTVVNQESQNNIFIPYSQKNTTEKDEKQEIPLSKIIVYPDLGYSKVFCFLCCRFGGVFEMSTNDEFVHVVCALMIPELCWDENKVILDTLEQGRGDLVCQICGKNRGCVQCPIKSCSSSFHPTCARENGQCLRFFVDSTCEEDESQPRGPSTKVKKPKKSAELPFQVLCTNHSNKFRAKKLEKILYENSRKPVPLGTFIEEKVLPSLNKALRRHHSICEGDLLDWQFDKIVEYWKMKRLKRQNGRMPFIYLLHYNINYKKQSFDADNKISDQKHLELVSQFSLEKIHEIMKNIIKEMQLLKQLIGDIKKREVLKIKIVLADIQKFENVIAFFRNTAKITHEKYPYVFYGKCDSPEISEKSEFKLNSVEDMRKSCSNKDSEMENQEDFKHERRKSEIKEVNIVTIQLEVYEENDVSSNESPKSNPEEKTDSNRIKKRIQPMLIEANNNNNNKIIANKNNNNNNNNNNKIIANKNNNNNNNNKIIANNNPDPAYKNVNKKFKRRIQVINLSQLESEKEKSMETKGDSHEN